MTVTGMFSAAILVVALAAYMRSSGSGGGNAFVPVRRRADRHAARGRSSKNFLSDSTE